MNTQSDTPITDAVYFNDNMSRYDMAGEMKRLERRVKRLEEVLGLIQPTCECVHHSKEHRHAWNEPCPVVEMICRVREAKL